MHETMKRIPKKSRADWYKVPELVDVTTDLAKPDGFVASSSIPGIRAKGDRVLPGDVVPFRWFDHVPEERMTLFFEEDPTSEVKQSFGFTPYTPTSDELEILYTRYPAMKPVVKVTADSGD